MSRRVIDDPWQIIATMRRDIAELKKRLGETGPLPYYQAHQETEQTLTDGTVTPIMLDTIEFDSEGGRTQIGQETPADASQYLVRIAGLYIVGGAVGFETGPAGARTAAIAVNDTVEESVTWDMVNTGYAAVPTRIRLYRLAVDDLVELRGSQGSGGDLNTINHVDSRSTLTIACIRRL